MTRVFAGSFVAGAGIAQAAQLLGVHWLVWVPGCVALGLVIARGPHRGS